MYRFRFLIKNEKLKQYHRIAFLIILINLLIFIYLAVSTGSKDIRISSLITAALLVSALSIDYFLEKRKKNEDSPYKLLAEYLVAMAWWKLGYGWLALLFFVLGMLYLGAKRKLLVLVFNEYIIYPSLPKKKIEWQELNAVILKDGLLTIDFKNDKLIQQVIDENNDIDEALFNAFCLQQLHAAGAAK
ncbi:MAG: hypothetical protein HZA79_16695 [Sphingobacteriales bacterium]|nr:hypothetical protein [Sphingobacteriales bacterium]